VDLGYRAVIPVSKTRQNYTKTYNSGDSLVVTHLTTNPPVSCLNRAERTGSLVLKILWSYVTDNRIIEQHIVICALFVVAVSLGMRVEPPGKYFSNNNYKVWIAKQKLLTPKSRGVAERKFCAATVRFYKVAVAVYVTMRRRK
jgi:outer membrane protein assembly factor BamB